jgi:hypothetical protein
MRQIFVEYKHLMCERAHVSGGVKKSTREMSVSLKGYATAKSQREKERVTQPLDNNSTCVPHTYSYA